MLGNVSPEALDVTISALSTFTAMLELEFHVSTIKPGRVEGLTRMITPKVAALIGILQRCWQSAAPATGWRN